MRVNMYINMCKHAQMFFAVVVIRSVSVICSLDTFSKLKQTSFPIVVNLCMHVGLYICICYDCNTV